jgi:hypothetical protein
VKKLFLKKLIRVNERNAGLESYPQIIKSIGVFSNDQVKIDVNFINRLKSYFGSDCDILNFSFSKNENNSGGICINNKSIDFFGKMKDAELKKRLSDLDLVIDLNCKSFLLKKYIIGLANKSYKIAMGNYSHDGYHLNINIERDNTDLFLDEFFKYHKILSHE